MARCFWLHVELKVPHWCPHFLKESLDGEAICTWCLTLFLPVNVVIAKEKWSSHISHWQHKIVSVYPRNISVNDIASRWHCTETSLQAGQCMGEAAAVGAVAYSATACVSQDFHKVICARMLESVGDCRRGQLVNYDRRQPRGTNTLGTVLSGRTAEISQRDVFTPKTSLTHYYK